MDDDRRIAELQRRERLMVRSQTKALVDAAASGDEETFHRFAYPYDDVCVDWRAAMRKIAKLGTVSPEIRAAFLTAWIERKHLAFQVYDRRALADGLRVLLPCDYTGGMQIYRGTDRRLRRRHGFSWSSDIEVARKFARLHVHPELAREGVVLGTVAPADAILLIREPEDYYDEGEIVVDPYRLGRVSVVERIA